MHQDGGQAFVCLPHQERCCGGDLVGKAGLRDPQRVAEQIRAAAQVLECGKARHAYRHAYRAAPPCASPAVNDDQANLFAEMRAKARKQIGGRPSGSSGNNSTGSAPACGSIFERSTPHSPE